MKVVINKCYGGFSLSAKATKLLAELQGKKCYFYKHHLSDGYYEELKTDPDKAYFWIAFSAKTPKKFKTKAAEEAWWKDHYISNLPDDRADPLLIKVVEELGPEANGSCAELKIVEIPDGVSFEIAEYDGMEHIAETHRTWY